MEGNKVVLIMILMTLTINDFKQQKQQQQSQQQQQLQVDDRPDTSLKQKRKHEEQFPSSGKMYTSPSQSSFFRDGNATSLTQSTPSSKKPSTSQQQHHYFQQGSERKAQSSQSQFRAVRILTQSSKELGFESSSSSNPHDFSRKSAMKQDQFSRTSNSNYGWFPNSARANNKIPKNIFIDKEILYDQLQKQKAANNELLHQNNSLKTRLSGVQVEMSKIVKQTDGLEDVTSPFSNDPSKFKYAFKNQRSTDQNSGSNSNVQQLSIVLKLKQQIQDLKNEVSVKDKQLMNHAKSAKVTSIHELEVEIKMYQEECLRLRRMLDQSAKLDHDSRLKVETKGDQDHETSMNSATANVSNSAAAVMQVLRSDNIEMAANLQKAEQELYKNSVVIETLERQLKSSRQESQQLRRQIQENERMIENLKSADFVKESDSKKNSQVKAESKLKIELDKKIQENGVLAQQVQQKDKRIMDVEKRNRELEADSADKIQQERKEKQELQSLLEKERDNTFKMRQDLERIQMDRRFTKNNNANDPTGTPSMSGGAPMHSLRQIDGTGGDSVYIINSQTLISSPQSASNDQNFYQRNQSKKGSIVNKRQSRLGIPNGGSTLLAMHGRKLSKVSKEDVKPIMEQLKFQLMSQRISFQSLESKLLTEEIQKSDEVSIAEIYAGLMKPMLKIGDEENAIMVARYLIEDNEAEKITFDMNITNSISVVKSAMRHLLDNYVVLNPAQEAEEVHRIAQILAKHKGAVVDMLSRDTSSKRVSNVQCCERRQIVNAFEAMEITLSQAELEFIFFKLYQANQTLSAIPIPSIFTVFDPTLEVKEIQSSSSSNQQSHRSSVDANAPVKDAPPQSQLIKKDQTSNTSQNQKPQQQVIAPFEQNRVKTDESVDNLESEKGNNRRIQEKQKKDILDPEEANEAEGYEQLEQIVESKNDQSEEQEEEQSSKIEVNDFQIDE